MSVPHLNLGMIGHVDHGKTTLTEALSGTWTDRHSEELRRGVSIRLGYADTVFRKCKKCEYYTTEKNCPKCEGETETLFKVSFVDAPGHETLMATMLSGAAIMDGAVLVIAADEQCPQPQTKEHLKGLEIIGVENIVVVQNKIDLVSREEIIENYKQIKEFLSETKAKDAPIIPISAVHGTNVDKVIESVTEKIPIPDRDLSKPPRMHVARSFDVNKPGTKPENLTGGIIGGTLSWGKWKVGDEIEIRPGEEVQRKGKSFWEPLKSEIVSLREGNENVQEATPGGLIGVGTKFDPSYTKSDNLAGSVAGKPGTLPEPVDEIKINAHLLDKVVGMDKEKEVQPLRTNEPLMLNAGTATTVGTVTSARDTEAEIKLKLPVCTEEGNRVAISRRISGRWRLIGYGIISK
ncbi:translation initiation factor IF-2 subunit gamma [candidate division MSBL1 archaeon SCGC-AAA259I09]|uniref:Translation initiation factor 2 subunit gamma n=2 Tax=candidate division MSBL1 TaxID=215777 RepID=A0A133UTN9_9EURY|nr:translation initiation factor IF-2 subunit gamma [candidate division MSBL1 archaeon SCGC-AAA259D14]KXA97592.1 translation initiation factor IF-2 subunit gamma [candidate division MSBL1 archaeon SCGC-AAA259I09]